MDATTVYGMCCGIFLLFCMKGPFADRATCSNSSGLTFYIYLFSLFYYFLFKDLLACWRKIFLTGFAGERIFRSILVLGLVANPRAEK